MSGGGRPHRNGTSTVQLGPSRGCSKVIKSWPDRGSGGLIGSQSAMQHFVFLLRDSGSKISRCASSKRFFAATLTCIAVLMLLTNLRHHFQDNDAVFGNTINITFIPSSPPELITRPLPPVSFMDPPLPPDHPCQTFTLPPPPADKKRTGPRPCPVCYLPVEDAIKLYPPPGVFPPLVLKHLTYVNEDLDSSSDSKGPVSRFGGHPTIEDRRNSHHIRESMHIHCGFAKGSRPGVGSGFDISETDLTDMEKCRGIVVISAIFGNYDPIQQPNNISKQSKKNACFFMFVDEQTEAAINRDETYINKKKVGLWRVVTVRNIPYSDPRRTGKIPKLLSHRLFPNARFSLWIDGKLGLTVDPYQIFERFLWRSNDTFAISKHYRRFDVFVEAEANKAARKYNNASIDEQVEFYRKEGLTPYSSAKLPIISDVPEGCVIIREHTPLTNLFTCLWFNEVDRFTSRDQISFGIVRDKIRAQVPWRVNMFLDCERRNFVVQGYHRDVLEARAAKQRLNKELNKASLPAPLVRKTRLRRPHS